MEEGVLMLVIAIDVTGRDPSQSSNLGHARRGEAAPGEDLERRPNDPCLNLVFEQLGHRLLDK
ncbi:hypothetical protein D3C86_1969890 [compost metagenome]